jgi:hypothetical protein
MDALALERAIVVGDSVPAKPPSVRAAASFTSRALRRTAASTLDVLEAAIPHEGRAARRNQVAGLSWEEPHARTLSIVARAPACGDASHERHDAGCTTTYGAAQGSLSDLGHSLGGGFGHNTDPNGTSRRPDVYGEFTRPTLPTIGNR